MRFQRNSKKFWESSRGFQGVLEAFQCCSRGLRGFQRHLGMFQGIPGDSMGVPRDFNSAFPCQIHKEQSNFGICLLGLQT